MKYIYENSFFSLLYYTVSITIDILQCSVNYILLLFYYTLCTITCTSMLHCTISLTSILLVLHLQLLLLTQNSALRLQTLVSLYPLPLWDFFFCCFTYNLFSLLPPVSRLQLKQEWREAAKVPPIVHQQSFLPH